MELSKEILKYINYEKKGFFVEAGANDGVQQSNTLILEKEFGWTGILVEPSLAAFEICKKMRPNSLVYNYCLVSDNYQQNIIEGDFDGSLMSSVGGDRLKRNSNFVCKTITMQKLFDINNIKKVDLFSLDTEGYELNILNGIDFDEVLIENMIIEIYEKDKEEIFNFLKEKGYEIPICITNFNKIEHPNWDGTHNDYLFKKKK